MFTVRSKDLFRSQYLLAKNTRTVLCSIGVISNAPNGTRSKADCGNGEVKPPRHLCSDSNPSAPNIYDCRKYGHNLPSDSVMPCFETLPHFPTGIFRCTAGEVLGLGAAKCGTYKNPEYFSFHHMSFYDIHMLLRCYRKPSPKTGRKK